MPLFSDKDSFNCLLLDYFDSSDGKPEMNHSDGKLNINPALYLQLL